MDTKRQDKAVATANAYDRGNIAGLDEAMTRRLVASTVFTESNGGDLAVTNRQGYVGRYQAGAGWLADAGYIDKAKVAKAMSGYRSEWAWAESGGMTRFLQDESNWKEGLSLAKYKQSADLQDEAFKRNSDAAYHRAVSENLLKPGDDQEKIAGFLKARHIAGYGGAKGVLLGKPPRADSNGTTNYDYYNDIANNRDGLDQGMSQAARTSSQEPTQHQGVVEPHIDVRARVLRQGERGGEVEALQVSLVRLGYTAPHNHPLKPDSHFGPNTEHAVRAFQQAHGLHVDGIVGRDTREALARAERTPLLSEATHPHHALFDQARQGLRQLPPGSFHNDRELTNVAAALALKARENGVTRIDHALMNTRGDGVFAVQGNPFDPARHVVLVDKAQAAAQTVAHSTELMAAQDSSRLHAAQAQAQLQHQEHRAGLVMAMRP